MSFKRHKFIAAKLRVHARMIEAGIPSHQAADIVQAACFGLYRQLRKDYTANQMQAAIVDAIRDAYKEVELERAGG